MITVRIEDKAVQEMMRLLPKEAGRAAVVAINKTTYRTYDAVGKALPHVFDRPAPYTLTSLKYTKASFSQGRMEGSVLFREPDRMGEHYLLPQVEGGQRKLKGFERVMGGRAFYPAKVGAKLDRYGNMPYGVIVQMLSVFKRAEYLSGYQANKTARSEKHNQKDRDYVWLKNGHGKLPPGVYERMQTGVGFGAKTKKHLPFGVYQKGRTKGRFASAIRARGLRPVLIESRKNVNYRKRLPFYEIAQKVYDRSFLREFHEAFARKLVGLR